MTYRIADILLDWYSREGRDLPWRRTRDPYRIWLSEVILQQTRVAQGTEYYLRFVGRFPDVRSLASASEDEVLKLWQGLGYYSRARNLHAAARQVVDDFGGRFPTTFAGVRSLRGVGDYTAAAVCSAAYSLPYAAVDGNVYRVLSRLFDIAEPIDTASGRRLFAELARSQLDERDPGRYNQAIMDFGALRCTPSPPRCGECPFGDRCLAPAPSSRGGRRCATAGSITFISPRAGGPCCAAVRDATSGRVCTSFRCSKPRRPRISGRCCGCRVSRNCWAMRRGGCSAVCLLRDTSFRIRRSMRFSTASRPLRLRLPPKRWPFRPGRWATMPCRGLSTAT